MLTVLVVEDDPGLRELITLILSEEGHVVRGAEDGAMALDLLRTGPRPDVIVTDLLMPVLDGWGMITQCRALEGCQDLPIVVLSASSALLPRARAALANGQVQAYLAKPFDIAQLLGAIEVALKAVRSQRLMPVDRRPQP